MSAVTSCQNKTIPCDRRRHLCRYRVDGSGGWETGYRWDPSRVLVDPYARHVAGRSQWATRDDFEKFETTVCQ